MKSLFETSKITKISYSPKPLPLLKEEDVIELSIEEFQCMIAERRGIPNFIYTESLTVPNWFTVKASTNFSNWCNINPAYKLVVCDMGETGLGNFAKVPIKKGEIVAIYSGSVEAEDPEDPYNVLNTISYPDDLSEIMSKPLDERTGLINPVYTAKKEAGLGSIFQSLPKINRLARQEKDNHIATANISQNVEFFTSEDGKKVGLSYFIATRDIEAKEQVGWDYGSKYFTDHKINELFYDTNGNTYTEQMLNYTDQFFAFFIQNLIARELTVARDCLCSLHPYVLNNYPFNDPLIQELLLEVASLDLEIENDIARETCDNYKHLSAMQALKDLQPKQDYQGKQIHFSYQAGSFSDGAGRDEDDSLNEEKSNKCVIP